jgi:periplasmic protein TonB
MMGMPARRPTTLLGVCAAHVALGWALLTLGTDGAPSSARARLEDGFRLVSVHLLSAAAPGVMAPVAVRAQEANTLPPPPTPPAPQAAIAEAVRAAPAAAPAALPAAVAIEAPGPAAAESSTQADAALVAAARPERPEPAANTPSSFTPTPLPNGVAGRSESPPVVVAQADRGHCPPAPHPAALRERGIEGAVVLRVKVDVQGRAAEVQLLAGSGWRLFDEAALQQVRACRFLPATQGGRAIDSWVEFPVRFALSG